MADHSLIEWTDATWNPITGCSVVSPGCTNCYAMKLAGTRLKHHDSRKGLTRDSKAGPVWTGEVRLNEQWLDQPLCWKKPRRIFVCAHGDLFAENVPDAWIMSVVAVSIASWLLNGHTLQILTKRAARMRQLLNDAAFWEGANIAIADLVRHHYDPLTIDVFGPDNMPSGVWLGVSAEDQQRADERVPDLLATPAAVRFVSAEPLLGPINLHRYMWPVHARWPAQFRGPAGAEVTYHRQALVWAGAKFINWVIVGGESGPDARPVHPDWVRSLRDQCTAAGTAFFFKQWGEWTTFYDRDAEDPDWRHVPNVDNQMGRGVERWHNLAGGTGFHGERLVAVRNVGKKIAGRHLDGVEYNSMPEVR